MPITIQTGAHQFNGKNITKYALTLGGLNTTNAALKQWDPLVTNYPRLFMVRKPMSVVNYYKSSATSTAITEFDVFKHLLEYGNLGVTGLSNVTVDFDEIKGGYAGRSFEIPKGTTDGTNEITVKVLELNGSPIRGVLHTWVNSTVDLDSGLLHYNGQIAAGKLGYSQATHTAEFIFVQTDRSGMKVEYACHLTNCFPTEIPVDHFNADDPSDHKHVELDVKFKCTKREGIDVNEKAKRLLMAYQIMTNSLEYCTGLNDNDIVTSPTGYNPKTGLLDKRDSLTNATLRATNQKNNNEYRSAIYSNDTGALATGTTLKKGEGDWDKVTPSYTSFGAINR